MPETIIGLDGHTPIYDPNRRFTQWILKKFTKET